MNHVQSFRDLILSCCLPASLLLAFMIPSFILSFLKITWQCDGRSLKLSYWKKIILCGFGGLTGAIIAIAVFPFANSNWCRDMSAQGSHCDGQGGLILIITVPLCIVIGSCASILWTWISVAIPAQKPWASIFSYGGGNRAMNVAFAVAIQILYWTIFALITYSLTRSLL